MFFENLVNLTYLSRRPIGKAWAHWVRRGLKSPEPQRAAPHATFAISRALTAVG